VVESVKSLEHGRNAARKHDDARELGDDSVSGPSSSNDRQQDRESHEQSQPTAARVPVPEPSQPRREVRVEGDRATQRKEGSDKGNGAERAGTSQRPRKRADRGSKHSCDSSGHKQDDREREEERLECGTVARRGPDAEKLDADGELVEGAGNYDCEPQRKDSGYGSLSVQLIT